MRSSEFSKPFVSEEASLLRQSRFWMAQLALWLLITPLYFRDEIETAIRAGLVSFTATMTVASCAMAMACSSVLAAVYRSMPPRWLTGVRAIPIALGLSLLAAVPWTTVMALLLAGATSVSFEWRDNYSRWMFFHASVLMSAWSGGFLWLMLGDRIRKTQARVLDAGAFALEAEPPDPKEADRALRRTRDATSGSTTESAAVPWGAEDRVRLREGKSVKFCRVREIAFIRAADDYTEVHLSDGQVAIVMRRLRYWESQLPESFVRIHRSTLVNLELTEELVHLDGAWRVRLQGCPEPLTVSRRFAQAVKAKVDGRRGSLSM